MGREDTADMQEAPLCAQCARDSRELFEVVPFVDRKSLGIRQYGRCEHLVRPDGECWTRHVASPRCG